MKRFALLLLPLMASLLSLPCCNSDSKGKNSAIVSNDSSADDSFDRYSDSDLDYEVTDTFVECAYFSRDLKILTSYYGGCSSSYHVPEGTEIIAPGAFLNTSLNEVVFPKGLKRIGGAAFCESEVRRVVFSEGPLVIGDSAFFGCSHLNELVLAEGLDSIGHLAFRSCDSLLSFKLPASVRFIGVEAFHSGSFESEFDEERQEEARYVEIPSNSKLESVGYKGLRGPDTFYVPKYMDPTSITWAIGHPYFIVDKNHPSLSSEEGVLYSKDKKTLLSVPREMEGVYTMPNSVTAIDENAFYQNDVLEKLVLSPNLDSLEEGFAFGSFTALQDIVLPSKNEKFCTVDGVLFNADTTVLICYPAGKMLNEYWMPKSVREIGYGAFYGCSTKKLVIQSDIKKIGPEAFYDMRELERVDILEPVEDFIYSFDLEGEWKWGGSVKQVYLHSNTKENLPEIESFGGQIFLYDESTNGFEEYLRDAE